MSDGLARVLEAPGDLGDELGQLWNFEEKIKVKE